MAQSPSKGTDQEMIWLISIELVGSNCTCLDGFLTGLPPVCAMWSNSHRSNPLSPLGAMFPQMLVEKCAADGNCPVRRDDPCHLQGLMLVKNPCKDLIFR
jgi:hypothetical protein